MSEVVQTRPDIAVVPESGKDAVIATMQKIAPAGAGCLDAPTRQHLTELTGHLVEHYGYDAEKAYDQYVHTAGRELELPTDRLHEQLEGKIVLVTGGTGIIGSTLIDELTKYNPHRIVSVSRGETTPYKTAEKAQYLHADIRHKEEIVQIVNDVQPDIIYHVAAYKYNGAAESQVRHALSTNTLGTSNVLAAAREADIPQIVYASTGKASRPFTPDIYASSKKVGEALMATAAQEGQMLVSAARFTHVADNSYFINKLQNWIDNDETITLHDPNIYFYVQSARESAQLLLNAGLEAKHGHLDIHAIRNLGLPVSLTDLAIGALHKSSANVPVYFCGYNEGYEDKAWAGLYDPATALEVSPLINSLEAPQTVSSGSCPQVDVFPLEITPSLNVKQQTLPLYVALGNESLGVEGLRAINEELGLKLLTGRLEKMPASALARAAKLVGRLTMRESQKDDHQKINSAILSAAVKSATV